MSREELIAKITSNITEATDDDDMPDLSNDPFVIRKTQQAEANLKKWGLPDAIKNRRK